MRDAVICEPLRTPVGGFGGALRDVPAQELAATVIRELMSRTGLPPEAVDDVLLGHCYPTMEAPAIGRVAALDAGLPVSASGLQIDRRCGSGLQAVLYAAMQVQTGASEVVLAGGAESMSNASFYSTALRSGAEAGPGVLLKDSLARGRVTAGGANFPLPGGMLETAENLGREYRIPREEQDGFAVRSHQRAAAAEASGIFDAEIVPVTVRGRKGDVVVERDEHIRPDSSVETLSRLRPVLGRQANYATAKAGLQGFTKTVAIELGRFGVTVNCIAPGFIQSDMTRATAERLGQDWESYVAARMKEIPVGRAGVPEDIAAAVSFFVREEAGYVTGQVLYVAGGPRA